MPKKITIVLNEDEAKEVTSLLNHLTGRLQYRATQIVSKEMDESWQFWNTAANKFNGALGMTYMDTTTQLQQHIFRH